MFHPAPAPSQEDIEQLALRVSKRILRFLQRRGVITLVTAPGDGEVTVVPDETMGEKDPLLAKLLAAATTGAAPAGPVTKRLPIRARGSCADKRTRSIYKQPRASPSTTSPAANGCAATSCVPRWPMTGCTSCQREPCGWTSRNPGPTAPPS